MQSALRFRLLFTSGLTALITLGFIVFVMNALFRGYFQESIRTELESHLLGLTGQVGLAQNGTLAMAEMNDQRFTQPLSGYYWQVESEGNAALLSPSLWGPPLEVKRPENPGKMEFGALLTDGGEELSWGAWVVKLGQGQEDKLVQITVAIDRKDISSFEASFFQNSLIWMVVLAVFFILASWVQMRISLRPLGRIRQELDTLRQSPHSRLSADFPDEIQPLSDTVNDLMSHNQLALSKARENASNLAHGLKTPLTILHGVKHRLGKKGEAVLAQDLENELANMEHIVERELARVRDSAQTTGAADINGLVGRLHSALARTQRGQEITWDIEIDKTLRAPFDDYDLTELLGNLLDNAMKWTKDKIAISTHVSGKICQLLVEDNGQGISADQRGQAFERGARLDTDKSGSGLGLSIVSDMAKAHGCKVSLSESSLGGLCVTLEWDAADKDQASK